MQSFPSRHGAGRGTGHGATLSAAGVGVERNGSSVLSAISLVVAPGTRLGIVGPNGAGKSTLLAILAGHLRPDSGTVRRDPPEATVGLLDQEHESLAGETVGTHLTRLLGISGAEEELRAAASAMTTGAPGGDPDGGERYAEALERYLALGAPDFEARSAVLDEVGLGAERRDQLVGTLSGGQTALASRSAAIMLSRFEVTLLDEPTNDLDFDGLELLEQFVLRTTGSLVVVSHDRAFIERCVTEVLELDDHSHGARLFGGGWQGYLAERVTERAHAEEAHDRYEQQRSELTDRARREREWATQGARRAKRSPSDHDSMQQGFRLNRTEKLAARARRTERALESLETVDKPWEGWRLDFSIGEAPRAGAIVARLDGAVIERGRFRLGPLSMQIEWGDRVALTGPNGSGKSTLVQALLGRLALSEGSSYLGPSVVVGELSQERRPASGELASALDELVAATGSKLAEARSLLAKFGLGAAEVTRPAASLSAGQRTRAQLARFQALGVNFLVLDEPTNHLDLPAIEQLEVALERFTGTMLVVSHDRRLLDAVELTRRIDLADR